MPEQAEYTTVSPDGSHHSGRTLDSPEISIMTSSVSTVSGT
ncbi:hypothetical protein [Rhodococcus sp. 24CO]